MKCQTLQKMPTPRHGMANRSRLAAPFPGGVQAKAIAKVGASDVARLSWFLDILNLDAGAIERMSDDEFRELQTELVVFCEPVGSIGGDRHSALSRSSFEELRGEVFDKMLALLSGYTIEFQLPNVTLAVLSDLKFIYMGTSEAIFRLAVARLVEKEGCRVKRCARPDCRRLFALRKRGLYCSRKCSQLVQFKRYLERHSK
jgi:hypothetical protein